MIDDASNMVNPQTWTAAIVAALMEGIFACKLFHWSTVNFASHESSGALANDMFEKMDTLVESMLSKCEKSALRDTELQFDVTVKGFRGSLHKVQQMLRALDSKESSPFSKETQILNQRDEILSSIDKFLYLDKQFGM